MKKQVAAGNGLLRVYECHAPPLPRQFIEATSSAEAKVKYMAFYSVINPRLEVSVKEAKTQTLQEVTGGA